MLSWTADTGVCLSAWTTVRRTATLKRWISWSGVRENRYLRRLAMMSWCTIDFLGWYDLILLCADSFSWQQSSETEGICQRALPPPFCQAQVQNGRVLGENRGWFLVARGVTVRLSCKCSRYSEVEGELLAQSMHLKLTCTLSGSWSFESDANSLVLRRMHYDWL